VPSGPGIRDDSGVQEGDTVQVHYDPMISKLIAHGADRAEAIARMRRALREYRVLGIETTLPFFQRVLDHPAFVAGSFDTSFVEGLREGSRDDAAPPWEVAVMAASLGAFRERQARRLDPAASPSTVSRWRALGWRDQGRP
jgi:acetyl-CoA carboxylase biotin carboxylase subunit